MPFLEVDHFCLSCTEIYESRNGEENKDMKYQDCNGEPCCMRTEAHTVQSEKMPPMRE